MLSVLLLTRDRKALLEKCLESLLRQEGVEGAWEIVVVDTGSNDGSRAMLRDWAASKRADGPERRWIELGGPNQKAKGAFAQARGAALKAARGEKLLFTDDDCVAPHDWVARAERGLEEWDAVGGLVLAANQLPFQRWWAPEAAWLPGLSVPGCLNPEWAGSYFYPQTANLALRRDALPHVPFPSFLNDFGTGGGIYQNEREDSALWRRMRRDGRRVVVDPGLIVFHHTPPERARLGVLLKRAWRDGRAEAFQRFSPDAAAQATSAIGESFVGAATALVLPGRSFMPPLAWGVRELAHAWTFRGLANAKKRRKLVAPLLKGFARAPVEQAKCVAGDIAGRGASRRDPGPPPSNPKTVLLVADGFLGDLVLLQPALRALKAQEDAPRVVMATSRVHGLPLYERSGLVDAILPVDGDTTAHALREAIAAESPDLALLAYWQRRDPAILLGALSEGPGLLGFDKDAGLVRRRHLAKLTWRLEKDWRLHEIDNIARLLQWAGLRSAPLPFDFDYLPEAVDHEKIPEGSVFLHWGSVEEPKRWSYERWAELAAGLRAASPHLPIVVSGAPSEADEIHELLRFFGLKGVVNGARLEAMRVPFAIPAFRRGRLLVTTCSGPKHLAMAAGIPTLTLYGVSEPARWGAYFEQEKHKFLRKIPSTLTPSEMAGLPANHAALRIEAAEALAASLEMLGLA